ncbi:hypothetical protein FDH34_gp187 [Serratia phage BF]|uniref:Uncharacterized protein n=3 Tax=Eneladusvirus BF TaxID=2560751 RepID=A0A7L8ZN56_9CAUD|nr:hypothetical protein FDH34_gp187 [Serratia phage BF]AQW88712.1 hypothetical protein BF_0187 [Serratia phage BF]QOI71124.1 hypothetical protein pEaSNUABM12_00186 [Erwinia phage pEa_SNUABM_12]QOI71668.1 hypothetical protein pEaSNUABM47_00184 [Erwinia phage pEa_SNUABM_47]
MWNIEDINIFTDNSLDKFYAECNGYRAELAKGKIKQLLLAKTEYDLYTSLKDAVFRHGVCVKEVNMSMMLDEYMGWDDNTTFSSIKISEYSTQRAEEIKRNFKLGQNRIELNSNFWGSLIVEDILEG